jgi:hypothetical protein
MKLINLIPFRKSRYGPYSFDEGISWRVSNSVIPFFAWVVW